MGLSPLFSQKLKGYSWNWLRFYRLRTAHTQTDIRPSHLMPWLSVTWPINTSTNSISPFPLWQLTVTAMHHACKPPTRALWPIKKIENLCNFCSYDLQTLWLNFIKKKILCFIQVLQKNLISVSSFSLGTLCKFRVHYYYNSEAYHLHLTWMYLFVQSKAITMMKEQSLNRCTDIFRETINTHKKLNKG